MLIRVFSRDEKRKNQKSWYNQAAATSPIFFQEVRK